jgi:N utilization substance protein A
MELEGMTEDLAQRLVEQGYLSYDDLSLIEPDYLMEMGGISAEQVDLIVEQADQKVAEAEKLAEHQKMLKKLGEQTDAKSTSSAATIGASVNEDSVTIVENSDVVAGDSMAGGADETSEVAVQSDAADGSQLETMDQNDDSDQK